MVNTSIFTTLVEYHPIVVLMKRGEPGPEDFTRALGTIHDVLQTSERFVLLIDARGTAHVQAGTRAEAAAFMQKHELRARLQCLGVVLLQDSAVIAGTLTALTWLAHPPYPMKSFSKLSDAMSSVRSLLADGHALDGAVQQRMSNLQAYLSEKTPV